ncbi:hypothetical protein ME763_07655 [Streptomyces murinus]|uniref:hypothetical protein n=1 Tax=Streptomyces murinus TaxID=33900 RepID=UPI000A1E94FC|nr:hypothetical protein [Streptomyces murinus]WDO05538.1 hypothetical protein ME763_07655 [Streptomyces murinus]
MDERLEIAPELPPMPTAPPAPPRSTRRRAVLWMVIGAVLIAGISSGVTVMIISGSDSSAPISKPKTVASASAAPAEDDAKATEASYNDSPVPDDFALALKTTERQCFGSAGCNVTVEPNLTYAGVTPLDPDKSYSITYEVHGDTSGPVIQTMELSDQDQLSYTPVSISTASRSAKVSAKITDVTVSS